MVHCPADKGMMTVRRKKVEIVVVRECEVAVWLPPDRSER